MCLLVLFSLSFITPKCKDKGLCSIFVKVSGHFFIRADILISSVDLPDLLHMSRFVGGNI